jgi:germination protein M
MLQWKTTRLAILFFIITLLTAGCGLFGPEQTQQIDPPPSAIGLQTDIQNTMPAATTEAENSLSATLYFYDEAHNVTPITLNLPEVEGIAQTALSFMVKGGTGEALLPSGFSAVLPEGTTVLGMDIKPDKLAIVDFSKEFLNYEAKDEMKLLQAVTWTLTEFPTIKQVKLRVAGKDLNVMPVAKTPIDRPLSRKAGINLEIRDNVNLGQTMPVTVYFQGTNTAGDYTYYVPVTRLVPRNDDVAKATIEELILGPKQGSSLFSSVLPSTELIQIAISGDKVIANFSKDLLSFGESSQASVEAVQSIVLSVTENTGMNKVQIMVDGDSKIVTGEKSLEKPVNRPERINKFKF